MKGHVPLSEQPQRTDRTHLRAGLGRLLELWWHLVVEQGDHGLVIELVHSGGGHLAETVPLAP